MKGCTPDVSILFTTSMPSTTCSPINRNQSRRKTVAHLPKDDVFAIEPRGGHGGDEELAAVGVGPGIGHRQHARRLLSE